MIRLYMDEDGMARKLARALRRLLRVMTHKSAAEMVNQVEFLTVWSER